MNVVMFQEASHGWRVKKLKAAAYLAFGELPKGCTRAAAGSACFCDGSCQRATTNLAEIAHHAALAEDDKTRIG